MASPAIRLDQPPVQPPEVSTQMNAAGPGSRIAAMAQQIRPSGPAASTAVAAQQNPQGAMLVQADAVKKVLDQMAKMNEKFAPFANRMVEIMTAGLNESLSQQPGAVAPPPVAGTPKVAGPGEQFPG